MKYLHLLVFLLGAVSSHAATVTLVNHTDSWQYHKGTNEPAANWKTVDSQNLGSTWLTGVGGIGYADGDDGTVLADMRNTYTTVYIRHTFAVTSPIDPAEVLTLTVDYDDAFIAYLDGAEIARSPNAAATPLYSSTASSGHEASAGAGGNPPSTFNLGVVGTRLGVGNHIMALIGFNDAVGSSDLSLIPDLVLGSAPGVITTDTTWRAANSPYIVEANVTVSSGVTLTIEPGVTVLFNQGTSLLVDGRLLAIGEPTNRITFTRNTGATSWNAVNLRASSSTSHIAHADFNYSSGNIDATSTTVVLQDLTWSNTTAQLVDLVGCSVELLDSFIPGGFGNEPIHFSSFPANGHAIVKGNVFGAPQGYNDSIDFTGGNRPGPIVQFIDNVFLAAVDDCLDLDGTDAHIEGNIFINVHQDATRDSTSNAISTGADGNNTSELVIVRNIFYDCDHALLLKDFGSAIFENNTVVTIRSNQFSRVPAACINFGEPHRGVPGGRGILMDGNIFWDVRAESPFLNLDDTMFFVMSHSIIPGTNVAGIGNSTNDPMFVNWQGPITAANIRSNLALLPGSPAIGTGPNGLDMGALVPSGASISGVPTSPTTNTNITLRIAGPGVVAYKWRLNNGPWSAEIPLTNSFQISLDYYNPTNGLLELRNLTNGTYTIYAIGKNSAGAWQSTNAAASKSWIVGTSGFRIDSASRTGTSVTLRFTASSGVTYSVLYRDALDAAHPWTKLKDVPAQPTTGPIEVFDNTATPLTRFYELVTPAQP
jgi:hypothetical protein